MRNKTTNVKPEPGIVKIPFHTRVSDKIVASLLKTLNQYNKLEKRKRKKGIIWKLYVCPKCDTKNWTTNLVDVFTVCSECSSEVLLPLEH